MNSNAFNTLSYGVYLVSAGNAEVQNAFIANSVFQISASPYLIAVSCSKNNYTAELMLKHDCFSISVLPQNYDAALLGNFGFQSGKNIQKFAKYAFSLGETTHCPIVKEHMVAWMECKLTHVTDAGTHLLMIGEVTDADVVSTEEPLTYAYYHQVKKGILPPNAPHAQPVKEEAASEQTEHSELENTAADTDGKYVCQICGYVYDPAKGDPDCGIAPGTPFDDLPDDWCCPICGVNKDEFEQEC